jgi:ribosomal-protein-alanine N-acetyltransferase
LLKNRPVDTSGRSKAAGRDAERGLKSRRARAHPEVQRLAYSDLPQVIAIERRSFPAPWSLAMYVLELSKPSSICLAAFHRGKLIGYLVCSRYHTVWHLMNVAVDLPYRRTGVATTLIERLFAEAGVEAGRYTLEVRVSNSEAIRMYESFGFRKAGVRRRYYSDNGEDALIMWRTHLVAPGVTGLA